MIKIDFKEPNTPEWRNWRLQCAKATDHLISGFKWGESIIFDNDLYKKQKNEVYVNKRNEQPFHGKCAYCEEVITSNQRGDIDHYRPKGGVTDAENRPVQVIANEQHHLHPGYYWLAYDWQNLLPACILCNQLSWSVDNKRIGKGTHFPIEGDYVCNPGQEKYEQPLLLNPCLDDPQEHLKLDDIGFLIWKTDRGRTTVDILGLNERSLPERRKRVIEDVRHVYMQLFCDKIRGRENGLVASAMERVREVETGKMEFALAGRRARSMARAAALPLI